MKNTLEMQVKEGLFKNQTNFLLSGFANKSKHMCTRIIKWLTLR